MSDSGFEPLTSSASRKQHGFLSVSDVCKIPANQVYHRTATFPELSGHSLGLLHGCCSPPGLALSLRFRLLVVRAVVFAPPYLASFVFAELFVAVSTMLSAAFSTRIKGHAPVCPRTGGGCSLCPPPTKPSVPARRRRKSSARATRLPSPVSRAPIQEKAFLKAQGSDFCEPSNPRVCKAG